MLKQTARRQIAEINVVPYIDVMLVLLIIFMVTAPLLFHGVDVNLPTISSKQIDSNNQPEPIILSIDVHGNYYLNTSLNPNIIISQQDLLLQITSKLQNREKTPSVLIKADKDVNYGIVMQAMAILQKAGANNIGLLTSPIMQNKLIK